MPVPQLMAGQGRSHQHQRVAARVQLMQEADKGPIQGAQPAAFDPAFEQQQQVVGVVQGRQVEGRLHGLVQGSKQVLGHNSTPCSQAGSGLGGSGLCGSGWPWNIRSRRSINCRGGRAK